VCTPPDVQFPALAWHPIKQSIPKAGLNTSRYSSLYRLNSTVCLWRCKGQPWLAENRDTNQKIANFWPTCGFGQQWQNASGLKSWGEQKDGMLQPAKGRTAIWCRFTERKREGWRECAKWFTVGI